MDGSNAFLRSLAGADVGISKAVDSYAVLAGTMVGPRRGQQAFASENCGSHSNQRGRERQAGPARPVPPGMPVSGGCRQECR